MERFLWKSQVVYFPRAIAKDHRAGTICSFTTQSFFSSLEPKAPNKEWHRSLLFCPDSYYSRPSKISKFRFLLWYRMSLYLHILVPVSHTSTPYRDRWNIFPFLTSSILSTKVFHFSSYIFFTYFCKFLLFGVPV